MLLALTAWSAGCLWIDGPDSRMLAGLLSAGFVAASLCLAAFVRPIWQMWISFAVLYFSVQFWWSGIEPSNARSWLAPGDVACVPCEPLLTNGGMGFPDDGFHDSLRRLSRNDVPISPSTRPTLFALVQGATPLPTTWSPITPR